MAIFGNNSDETIEGTDGVDVIYAKGGKDLINGLGGDDELYGGAGRDTLNGGDGNDYLNGGLDADWMYGGAGDDVYIVDMGRDEIVENEGDGTDTIWGYTPSITMAVYARNAGTDREINVRFVGNDLQVNRLAAAVRVRLAAGVAKSRFIEVEANSGTLRNLRKVYPDDGYAPSAG